MYINIHIYIFTLSTHFTFRLQLKERPGGETSNLKGCGKASSWRAREMRTKVRNIYTHNSSPLTPYAVQDGGISIKDQRVFS